MNDRCDTLHIPLLNNTQGKIKNTQPGIGQYLLTVQQYHKFVHTLFKKKNLTKPLCLVTESTSRARMFFFYFFQANASRAIFYELQPVDVHGFLCTLLSGNFWTFHTETKGNYSLGPNKPMNKIHHPFPYSRMPEWFLLVFEGRGREVFFKGKTTWPLRSVANVTHRFY